MADKLVYFDVRARGEAVRMVYAMAGKTLEEERITQEQWPGKKAEQPLGQLPVYTCSEGGTLVMSNSIARYVAKKFGLMGSNNWEEAVNDMIMETVLDFFQNVPKKIYMWKVFKREPEPEDSAKVIEEVKADVVKACNFIQSIAEKKGAKHLTCDKIMLADLWLYTSLEFCKLAFPDVMELTPWVKEFVSKMEANETFKKYLDGRPPSAFDL